MAKKRKNKRDIYTTAGRVDMRNGGRVKLWHGARPNPRFQRGASEAYDSYHVQYPTRADYEASLIGNTTGGNKTTVDSL